MISNRATELAEEIDRVKETLAYHKRRRHAFAVKTLKARLKRLKVALKLEIAQSGDKTAALRSAGARGCP